MTHSSLSPDESAQERQAEQPVARPAEADAKPDRSRTVRSPKPKRRHRRVIRPGKEQGGVSSASWDETDAAWGDEPQQSDDHYLRNRPPHWGP